MNVELLSKSRIGRFFLRGLAKAMESRFRYRFWGPVKILEGAGIRPGQTVLEIGCGTGYFTLPAAKLIGDDGHLVAIDILSESVELVAIKIREANLKNVEVAKRDAMNTGLDSQCFDLILLFGVIPAPMIPLDKLLSEIHRLLKADGILAVWPHLPGWLPKAILKSGLFTFDGRHNGVNKFKRCAFQ